jgi:hypothetical protein
MERQLEEAKANGAAGEDQLRAEIKKLLEEIEALKAKHKKEF